LFPRGHRYLPQSTEPGRGDRAAHRGARSGERQPAQGSAGAM